MPRAHYYDCNTLFDTLHLRHSLIIKRKKGAARARKGEGDPPPETGSAEVRSLGLPRVDKLIYQRSRRPLLSHPPQRWYKNSTRDRAQPFYTTLPALPRLVSLRRWYKSLAL